MAFRYGVYDWLTRRYVSDVDMTGVTFGDPLTGHGQLTGTLTLNTDLHDVGSLRSVIEADRAALYVITKENQIIWSGRIISAPWSRDTSSLGITAVATSQILNECLHGLGVVATRYDDVEQFQIVRNLISYMNAMGGYPRIRVGTERSGVLKDLKIEPQSYVELDTLIDGLAAGAKGFDWAIRSRFATIDGLPELYLSMYYPERQSPNAPQLLLQSTYAGGNIIDYGEFPFDLTNRRTDIIATGDGDVPAQMNSRATVAGVSTGIVPRRMKTTSYSGKGIVKKAVLNENARAELKALADTSGTLTVTTLITDPDIGDYLTGDRFRLRLQDEYIDVNLPGVRCVDRSIKDEDRDTTPEVTLTLDLNDAEPPDA